MRDQSERWAMLEGACVQGERATRAMQKSPSDLLSALAKAGGWVWALEARSSTFLLDGVVGGQIVHRERLAVHFCDDTGASVLPEEHEHGGVAQLASGPSILGALGAGVLGGSHTLRSTRRLSHRAGGAEYEELGPKCCGSRAAGRSESRRFNPSPWPPAKAVSTKF